jgi:hypothetical protein
MSAEDELFNNSVILVIPASSKISLSGADKIILGYTETGQGWQGNDYGYGHYQAYIAGYQQGLRDAQTNLTYDCSGHTQYYCNGYSQGFNTYE